MRIPQSLLNSIESEIRQRARELIKILPEPECWEYGFEFPECPEGWAYRRFSYCTATGINVIIYACCAGVFCNIRVYFDGEDIYFYHPKKGKIGDQYAPIRKEDISPLVFERAIKR
jgi:hypothetical protein